MTSTRSWRCTRPTWSSTTTPPGESAQGDEVREHIGSIFETWPDIHFETRRLYVRDGVVTQEWTATATHANTMRRGDLVAEPTGKTIEWEGIDVIPFEDGLVKRKDVYSDSRLDPAPGRFARIGCNPDAPSVAFSVETIQPWR